MEKLTQPQQLSFNFEEPLTAHAVVSLNTETPAAEQAQVKDSGASEAVVYDFRSAFSKRKESTHASLYRQILDSVRHIG